MHSCRSHSITCNTEAACVEWNTRIDNSYPHQEASSTSTSPTLFPSSLSSATHFRLTMVANNTYPQTFDKRTTRSRYSPFRLIFDNVMSSFPPSRLYIAFLEVLTGQMPDYFASGQVRLLLQLTLFAWVCVAVRRSLSSISFGKSSRLYWLCCEPISRSR